MSCSLIGCSSGATVDLTSLKAKPELWGSTAHLCVDAVCQDQQVTGREDVISVDLGLSSTPPSPVPTDAPVDVTLTLVKGDTEVLHASVTTTLSRTAPNGEVCGPICYSVAVKLTGSTLVPVT
jgi:hypothetical protein